MMDLATTSGVMLCEMSTHTWNIVRHSRNGWVVTQRISQHLPILEHESYKEIGQAGIDVLGVEEAEGWP